MKKIIALIAFAIFALPTFAFTIKVGDVVNYLPMREGKDSTSIVTKIASTATGFEIGLLSNEISFTYSVNEGEEINLYAKSNPKAKVAAPRKLKVVSIKNNIAELEVTSVGGAPADAK